MVERLSLHRLAYFVTAADIGTMSGAAQHLYVSQSAVSLGIAELERRLGVQLMLRSKAKGLSLTEAGRRLLPRARALLTQAEDLETDIRHERHAIAGRLAVGCFTSIGPFLLPRLLEAFQAAYPEVFLDFVEGSLVELQQSLRDGRCELAMLYDVGIETDIDYEELYGCHPYVLVSPDHPLADKEAIRLRELASHDMIMMDFPPSMQYFSEILADAGVNPIIRHRTKSFELTRSLVARGFGYSLLIQRPVTDMTYEGRGLAVRSIADDVAPLPVVLAWHAATRLSPRATAFATLCRTAIRQGTIVGDGESRLSTPRTRSCECLVRSGSLRSGGLRPAGLSRPAERQHGHGHEEREQAADLHDRRRRGGVHDDSAEQRAGGPVWRECDANPAGHGDVVFCPAGRGLFKTP